MYDSPAPCGLPARKAHANRKLTSSVNERSLRSSYERPELPVYKASGKFAREWRRAFTRTQFRAARRRMSSVIVSQIKVPSMRTIEPANAIHA